MKTITILDARGLMLRAAHSCGDSSVVASNGAPSFSWQAALLKFIELELLPMADSKIPLQNVIAAWDGGNTYRLDRFPGYKKRRLEKGRDDNVREQLKELQKQIISLMAYLGIKSVKVPGEEADDLIALLVERLEADHFLIKTNDSDLKQLISDKVSILWKSESLCTKDDPRHGSCPVELIALHKALVGDSTDGYPGVPGFGKVKFSEMLKFVEIDGMLQIQDGLEKNDWSALQAAYDASKYSNFKLILEHWSEARQSLNLAKLHPEACYGNYKGQKAKRPIWAARVPSAEKVSEILDQINMAAEAARFAYMYPREELITSADSDKLAQLAEEITSSPVVSWDYESSDKVKHQAFKEAKKRSGGKYVDYLSQEVAGISINFGHYMEQTIYIPFDHTQTANYPKEWLTWLLQVLSARSDRSVVQNASFELAVSLVNTGYLPQAPYDTAIMSSYVDENEENHLKGMSWEYLRYKQATYEEVTQGRDMCQLTGTEVLSYGCDDSLVTSHLFALFKAIMQLEGSWEFYSTNEVDPVQEDVQDHLAGQSIDYQLLEEQKTESLQRIEEASSTMRRLLAEHANQASEDEVYRRASILFYEWYDTERFKAKEEGDDERIRQEVWGKAWKACFYQEFEQRVDVQPFVATVTLLNKVIGAIDPNAPKLKKANGPGVEAYDDLFQQYRQDMATAGEEGWEAREKKLEEFVSKLFKARKKLGPASRKGDAYEELCNFCNTIMHGSQIGKTIQSGDQLNVNSSLQMQGLLYGKLGLPIRGRSKADPGSLRDREKLKGSPQTGLKAIAAAFVYDLPDEKDWRHELLEAYRTVTLESQNQSLYYRSYPLWAHPSDGRIHPQIRNCGTVTRRPAGSDPNKLQVSKKAEAKIRKLYLPGDYGDGPRVIVCADFANQELVITACESRDPVMLAAFQSEPRKDLHSLTSTGYAHILLPRLGFECKTELDYDGFMAMRKGAGGEELAAAANQVRNKYSKAVNFLIAYLGGHTTLAGNLLINKDLARELMDKTFSLYPRLAPWQQETIQFAREHGYTQTAYGNRRHATPDLWSSDDFLRTRQERQMVNAVIQGGAADILKEVRQAIHARGMREKYRMRAVTPVYDEIEASVPVERVPDYCEELVEVMTITPPGYPVGMKVDLSIGNTWGDQIELDSTDRAEVERVLQEVTND